MDRFKKAELTSTLRPTLVDKETVLAIQDNVGLYDGNEKAIGYMNGKVYLTSHRIVYVDSANPHTNLITVDLRLIKDREFYTGFVKSSPKITLRFTENNLSIYNNNNVSASLSPSSSSTSLISTSSSPSPMKITKTNSSSSSISTSSNWICPICSFSNASQYIKCQLCGVIKLESSTIASLSSSLSTNTITNITTTMTTTNISSNQKNETSVTTPSSNDEKSEIACPICTFLNHPSMIRCEICDAGLEIFNKLNFDDDVEISNRSSSGPKPDFVKLAFRGGGASVFYDKLKIAMSMKEWEKSDEQSTSKLMSELGPVNSGISGIIRTAEQNQKEQEMTLNQAFKDLDGLMAKAAEMVKLAESISNRLNKESQDSEESSADETLNFRTYMLELGIPNPVTKDAAGSIYHKELARQLAEFLENILEKENGIMSLIDIYCIFNRARGVALISPEDLHKACLLFEELSLPLRLRKYGSGILVVQSLGHSDEKTAQRILEYIQARGPITAIDLASLEKMSVVLVNEQLKMVEAKGLICRDETVEGIRFYDNLIVNVK